MNEETSSKTKRIIKLSDKQYKELERALQWPEDVKAWDKLNTPTNLSELPI